LLIAESIRRADPVVPIIFGGPQASVLAEGCLDRFPFIDYILQGEADLTLPVLMRHLLNGEQKDPDYIGGLTFRNAEHVAVTPSPPVLIRNLDELPVPLYGSSSTQGLTRIDAGRGCPFRCTFCSTNQFFSRKYRVKPVERLIREIGYCLQKPETNWIGISHDMFTLNRKFVEEFAERCLAVNKEKRKPFYWSCSSRTDCVTGSLLAAMHESGCRAIFFGMETGSPRIQQEIKKNLDPEEALGIVRHAVRLGIYTIVSYMLGFPGETPEDLNRTLRSFIRSAAEGASTQLTILSLIAGTPLYEEHLDRLKYDGKYSGFSMIYPNPQIESLILDHREIFSSFYYLPNKDIPRDAYLFISDAGNYLDHFIPTLVLVSDRLMADLDAMDLYSYIKDKIPEYPGGEDMAVPALFFLSDSLKEYLEWLDKTGLPLQVWDVFQLDFTKAHMSALFQRWQLVKASLSEPVSGGKLPDKNQPIITGKKPNPGDRIEKRPYWSIVKTGHYLYDYARNPVKRKQTARFRRGTFHYLVVPRPDQLSSIYKIPRSEIPVWEFTSGSTIGEIIAENKGILPEGRILHIIRRMMKINLVDIIR
jgi:radical SAM superfamily enzyme YgiQ (UPF0313 family)